MGAVVSADAPSDLLVSGGSPGRTFLPGDPAMPHAAGQVATGRIQDGEGGPMAANGPNADQWLRVKQRLRAELGEDVFGSWFGRVAFEEADTNSVYLSVPTRFLKSWITAHYGERLLALWQSERKAIARVEIAVRGAVRGKGPLRAEKPEAPTAPPARTRSSAAPDSCRRWL